MTTSLFARIATGAALVALLAAPAFAQDDSDDNDVVAEPHVVRVYGWKKIDGKLQATERIAGLYGMGGIYDRPGDNCGQRAGIIKVGGVQHFSGGRLDSFWFTAKDGHRWSVNANILNLPNAERDAASDFIVPGKSYYAHLQVCGSGGSTSLISLYDLNVSSF